MGKRSNFIRIAKDAYDTPEAVVLPLIEFNLCWSAEPPSYIEPCAGNGALIGALGKHGLQCLAHFDADTDARAYRIPTHYLYEHVDYFITNPPWTREILHPIIENLRTQKPTWLLFDADWMHTKQAIPYLPYCKNIVSVGRVKWIPDSPHTGKDNCCWYEFVAWKTDTLFTGRG